MIDSVTLSAAVLLLGLIMYAIFGGADFGGGIWTAFASGPRKVEQRESLFHAIGPVWETNHVWLIFVVVVLFTAFPKGFAAISIALITPLVIALIGINLRGAAFAFRHFVRQEGKPLPLIAKFFEISSILTPFALGMTVTATASGRVRLANAGNFGSSVVWITPLTLMGGLIGLAICAYLAPIFMTVRTTGELREDFRKRGIIAAIVLGLLTTAAIPVAYLDAPRFAEKLISPLALTAMVPAVFLGIAAPALLVRRVYFAAQLTAAGAVAMTLGGFGGAMYPDLLFGELTFPAAAAPAATLSTFLLVMVVGAAILAPCLLLLYRTFRGEPNPELPPDS
ncbi:MAG: cytochrome d ubiquinol oxidase subunit II [Geobacteraceae bacterium]